ncbi:desulfoferrodoxin family protein [Oscillospiraceae bacterium MB08-C2-2]|nr:desulfoferrodoxin family protein [Oscillospiraceae bacterium MB08-C2-2]
MEIFRCKLCGNIIVKLVDSGAVPVCCGEPISLLHANTTDAAQEKHVPAFSLEGNTLTVQVGDVLHPMTPEHFIQFILVEQDGKVQYTKLTPDQEPKATFSVCQDKPFTVYEYCNLHGLWKAEK